MNAQLTYDEILGYVEEKFHVRPSVDVVNQKTIHISYKMGVWVPSISVNVHVDLVSKDIIALSYDCSSIVNGLLKGVVGFVKEKIPGQVEVHTNEHKVLVHLDAFENLKKVWAIVEPMDITFSNDAVNVMFLLKP